MRRGDLLKVSQPVYLCIDSGRFSVLKALSTGEILIALASEYESYEVLCAEGVGWVYHYNVVSFSSDSE